MLLFVALFSRKRDPADAGTALQDQIFFKNLEGMMRIFNWLIWLVCTIIFLFLGAMLLVFSAHLKGWLNIEFLFIYLKNQPDLWLICGFMGLLIVVITSSMSRVILGRFQREKTIAFTNPEGQVTISLSAIEDLIRKVARQVTELKDLRCDVKANKKGAIQITARVTLWSDANIPDVTERVQSLIKSRVQNMLGLEETVTCSVHISKIVHRDDIKKRKHDKDATGEESFHGAIEYGVEKVPRR